MQAAGEIMQSWKRALVAGSISAGALLFLKRRYSLGVIATGVGLAAIASEYPEKFARVREALPQYFDRSLRVMEMAERAGRRMTTAAGQSSVEGWEELGG
jgi:hypothetical protein